MEEKIVETSTSLDWFSVFFHGSIIGISVLVLLFILSIIMWVIIVERFTTLTKLHKKSEVFLKTFWDAKSLSELNTKIKDTDYSPAKEVFKYGYNEMVRVVQAREKKGGGLIPFDTIRRALAKSRGVEEVHLAKNLTVLAIGASACPFIGLFGTVIGIIEAFYDIGMSGSSSLAAVAPGISQALIATAFDLAAAIPAVVFYNIFSSKIRRHLFLLEGFAADFLNILERHFTLGRAEAAVASSGREREE